MTGETQWALSEELTLDNEQMDAVHREFCDAVSGVLLADDDGLGAALDALMAHLQSHFDQEHAWMTETRFPALSCHHAEHQRVIEIAQEVKLRYLGGDLEIVRVLARELKPWFHHHAQSMDAMLAVFLNRPAERSKLELACGHGSEGSTSCS